MNLDVFNTHMELSPYSKGDYPAIEAMYTATDKFTQSEFPCGYMIEDGKLYLPRGTQVSRIEGMCKVEANFKHPSDPYEEMEKHHYSLFDPRDKLQEESIEFLMEKEHQLGLNLGTGRGKTFVCAYASSKLGIRTLIITPNEGLKQQWIQTYFKMFEYRASELINIAGGNIMDGIVNDEIRTGDVYFVNHATLRNYMTDHGGYALHQFFKKLKVGIKIYDESHMEFANILLIDFFSNVDRTWYLTATFDRSDKTESVCFKRAFNSVITFGEMESKATARKHVVYHVVNINSRITPQMRAKVIGYAGMTGASYGRYAFLDDPNQSAYNTILQLLEKVKNVEGKTLIFIPLIEAVDEVVKKLKKDWPDKTVGAYHSKVPSDEKESALKKDIIVTTIKSCGTGRDIPGLRSVICCEPIASKVLAEQLIGRLRPYSEDKDTYFFDVCDVCIPHINWWWKARYKKIQSLVKDTIYLNMDK